MGGLPDFVCRLIELLRARQKLGKYRIIKRLAKGPLADVYEAFDTIHKEHVALKLPKTSGGLDEDDFAREVRVAISLEHKNILSVRDASYIDNKFVIVMPLGKESLADRMTRRMSTESALQIARQAIDAVAFAHERKIIHCDIKPENFILFDNGEVRLTDFGFAKVSLKTLKASGSGTVDYISPEQAMGHPKFQSDVFSLGLVLYRLFSGYLPSWPFEWPMPGHSKLVERLNPELTEVLRRAIQLNPRQRFRDAVQMQRAFERAERKRRRRRRSTGKRGASVSNWRQIQWRAFQLRYKKELDTRHQCRRCDGPVSEAMHACPWCGFDNPARGCESTMPAHCPRCERGVKLDWDNCAWCYGAGFEPETNRRFSDKRYAFRCQNKKCGEPLMPFMRYCPWCRVKVKRAWKIKGSPHSCDACGWGIAKEFWDFCAWCREPVKKS